jgi:hypothetical protein
MKAPGFVGSDASTVERMYQAASALDPLVHGNISRAERPGMMWR